MPSLCESFRNEAGFVWNRMKKARTVGMRLGEETLTEIALLNIALAHPPTKVAIRLATKKDEAGHGGDWEWWFSHKGKGVGFRVQAKRLFPSGKYEGLFKKKKGAKPYDQLDTLVDAAKNAKPPLIPLYCFYNFPVGKSPFSARKNPCGNFRGPSFWGCSIAFPDDVKARQSDELAKLVRIMRPWHALVCDSGEVDVVTSVRAFLRGAGKPDQTPRNLPPHVTHLIELDSEYWPADREDISGIALFRDLRQS
jgi:Family of unknown function (DUF6615)